MTENQMIKNDDGIILQPFKEDIFWCVRPFFVDGDDDGSLVQLQWGWTAGMTEKDFENLADDAPRGLGAITMTFNDAIELRDKIEVLKQGRLAFLKSTPVPFGNDEAMGAMREDMAPQLMKDYFKADRMSMLGKNNSTRDA